MTVVLVSSSRNNATFLPCASIDSTAAKLFRCDHSFQNEFNESTLRSTTIAAGTVQANAGPVNTDRAHSMTPARQLRTAVIRFWTPSQKGSKAIGGTFATKRLCSETFNFSN